MMWFGTGVKAESLPVMWRQKARLCRKTPSSARERDIFLPGKDGETGDIGFIVDGAGRGQADNCGCLCPTAAAPAAIKPFKEKGPPEARSSFPTQPKGRGAYETP